MYGDPYFQYVSIRHYRVLLNYYFKDHYYKKILIKKH